MYETLIKLWFYGSTVLFIIAAAIQLGISLTDFQPCRSDQCLKNLNQATQRVLKINWKPITVFPNEAKRFRVDQ